MSAPFMLTFSEPIPSLLQPKLGHWLSFRRVQTHSSQWHNKWAGDHIGLALSTSNNY
jgi:hypothetical protein